MLTPLEQYWDHKGHSFGQNHSTTDSDLMYVNIPKNASTWTKKVLSELGWSIYNYQSDRNYDKRAMVVLRDPVDRWLTGIAEYLMLYHQNLELSKINNFALDLIFDRISFDDHTEQQIYFIDRLDLNKCIFFQCDQSYRSSFTDFMISQGYSINGNQKDYMYTITEQPKKVEIRNFFEQHLKQEPRYLEQLKNHFVNDYKLIESVKFYGS